MKKIAEVLIIIFVFSVGIVFAQKVNLPSQVWWQPAFLGNNNSESGKIDELKGKTRVYLSNFLGSSTIAESNSFREQINKQISEFEKIEIVNNPDEADFAFYFKVGYFPNTSSTFSTASNSSQTAQNVSECGFYVLTKGAEQADKSYRPRILFERLSFANDCRNWARHSLSNFYRKLNKLN